MTTLDTPKPTTPPREGVFERGIHPPERKSLSKDAPIEILPHPKLLHLALQQHLGAPAHCEMKPRTAVQMGDVVGETQAFVSAKVHTPLNGATAKVSAVTLPNGRRVPMVPIKADDAQIDHDQLWAQMFAGDWPKKIDNYTQEQIISACRDGGLVGLGGAAFPTHVKLSIPEGKHIDTLLVNGCECEPYLTADYRVMLESPASVVSGTLLAAKAVGASQVVIAIESNKPVAIEKLREAASGTSIQVLCMPTKYPMGGERQLIPAALNRNVPTGGLPMDVGVVVMNVGTSASLARAVVRNLPLTHRVVSVSGEGIAQPKNLLVPIGVPYQELIDYCGGFTPDAARVLSGGPMMGFAITDMSIPVTKGTSGITVLSERQVEKAARTACVRCGRCVDVCPLNLVPTKLAQAGAFRDWDMARRHHLAACCECGCCAYICPSGIPLAQLIRTAKAAIPREPK